MHCYPADAAKLEELQGRVLQMRERLMALDLHSDGMVAEFESRGQDILKVFVEQHCTTYDTEVAEIHAIFDSAVEQLEETSDCHDETRERVTRTDNYLTHVYVTIGIVGGTLSMQEGKRRELEAKLDQLISRKEIDEGSFIDDFQTKTQTISSSIHEAASTYQLHRAAESEQLGRMLDDADGQLASWQQTQAEVDARYTALMQWREHHNFNTWL
eukprot:gene11994-22810_t